MQENHVYLAIVFVVAAILSFTLAPAARWFGFKAGFVDKPRQGEVQQKPTARSGGYAMIMAFWVAVGVSMLLMPRNIGEQQRLWGLLVGTAIIVPVALFDDALRLSPRPQLIAQAVVGGVAIIFGIVIDNVANPFGGIVPLSLVIAIPVTLFWFVGMINTLNFIDTMDGMAAGTSGIAALVLFVRAFTLEQYTIAALMLALLGVCLGFLPYNLPTAKLFMGTSGSMFLGYTLAVLALVGGAKIATTLMVLGIPILDTAVVIATRTLQGRSPFKGGDAAHYPHRLLALGLSQSRILLISYALCLLLGYFALSLTAVQKLIAFGGVAVLLLALILIIARRTRTSAEDETQSSNENQ